MVPVAEGAVGVPPELDNCTTPANNCKDLPPSFPSNVILGTSETGALCTSTTLWTEELFDEGGEVDVIMLEASRYLNYRFRLPLLYVY